MLVAAVRGNRCNNGATDFDRDEEANTKTNKPTFGNYDQSTATGDEARVVGVELGWKHAVTRRARFSELAPAVSAPLEAEPRFEAGHEEAMTPLTSRARSPRKARLKET
jgi:hypothetical protein